MLWRENALGTSSSWFPRSASPAVEVHLVLISDEYIVAFAIGPSESFSPLDTL